MNKFYSVFVSLLIIQLTEEFVASFELTALNDSPHVLTLYEALRTEDPPSERDPARSSPSIRKSICDGIVNGGLVRLSGAGLSVDLERMYDDVLHPTYADLSELIYTISDDSNSHEYVNEYRLLQLYGPDLYNFTEYVFVCLSRFWAYSEILPFFVSKEYNISASNRYYKPGRFIFAMEHSSSVLVPPIWFDYALLAEEPATVHEGTAFDVEQYFLSIRKHSRPAESNVFDPLCKLVSDDHHDFNNQHHRLCVAVSRSSNYKHRLLYPLRRYASDCQYVEVSFRTPRGKEKAAQGSYYERMTPCYSEFSGDEGGTGATYLFISRSYASDQVFVYLLDPADGKIYLENLSKNVPILDELNSFDFIEE